MYIHKASIIAYILLCIAVSLFSLATPYISGNFIDYLIRGDGARFLIRYCILYIIISIGSMTLGYISNQLYIKLQTRLGFELNRDILIHIQQLPISYIKDQDTAYLSQRINNDSNTVMTFCISVIQNIIINAVTVVLSFGVVFVFNPIMAIALFALIPCYFIAYRLFKNLLFKSGFDLKERQSKFFGKLYEQLSHIQQVKIHSIGKLFLCRLNTVFERLMSSAFRYQKITYLFSGLDSFILTLAQIFLFLFGGLQVIQGKLSVGQFTIISSYFGLMVNSIRYFFSLGKNVQDNMVSYERLVSIINIAKSTNGNIKLKEVTNISLNNVSISFESKNVLENFCATFDRGNIYTIMGANGSGKSTLINLILGLYIDEFQGNVLFNGISIKQVDMIDARYRLIGVTEQEPVLFEDTIEFNLTFNLKKFSDDRLQFLMDVLGLRDFISSLPCGLKTFISEKAANISGGEKQKIALLRALLKDPDVLILDEPISALDSSSRNRLKEYLVSIKKQKLIIIITHDDTFTDISDVELSMVNLNAEKTV